MKSAVFFSYASYVDVNYAIQKAETRSFDQVILAVGGLNQSSGNLRDRPDLGLKVLYEERKLGKSRSFNRAIVESIHPLKFIISADTRFQDSVIQDMIQCIGTDSQMAIPRVVPMEGKGFSQKLGKVMWEFHDTHMSFMEDRKGFFCGGEFQLMRSENILIAPMIVNDDEYLCNAILSRGGKIRYCRNVVVNNHMPKTVRELFRQRVRVNFGHLQARRLIGRQSSFTISFPNLPDSFKIIRKFTKEYPGRLILAMLASILEGFSIILAYYYLTVGRDMSIW